MHPDEAATYDRMLEGLLDRFAPDAGPFEPDGFESDVGEIEREAEAGAADNPHELCRGTVVCASTLTILGVMWGWLGDSPPEQGDRLASSGSLFDDVGAQVAALDPDGGWRGNAAQAYWVQNLAQSRHATLMADLDRLTAGLVSAQADAVKQARERLSVLIAVVLGVLVVCAGLELGGPEGQLPSFHIAVAACGVVQVAAAATLIGLANKTSSNASSLRAATQRATEMLAARSARSARSDAIPGLAGMTAPDVGTLPFGARPRLDVAGDTARIRRTPDRGAAYAELSDRS
ncbi:ESX-1 secretion-associated protein EspA [Mycobacterium marinum]|nr:ESX-1 secretion-associated protein EspA [Mycobacterium marinum]RFZ01416.1 ESX-1 secretion-associated protein EspA [Mycobacterium marinum]